MYRRINLITALMVLNLSFSWVQADSIAADHSQHSVATERKSEKKSVITPAETIEDRNAMPGR